MNIAVIGTGYVGLTTGACFAEMGHAVMCMDTNAEKITELKKGNVPFFEPGLDELVKKNIKDGRLSFTDDAKEAIEHGQIIICAVDTPPSDESNAADVSHIYEVAEQVAKCANEDKVFIVKSTVPVGTNKKCKEIFGDKQGRKIEVVSNPEFLRQGCAINDTMRPDRIIIGVENEKTAQFMETLYSPLIKEDSEFMVTDPDSAELIKYASNAFLGMKISFINELAGLCKKVGGNIKDVSKGVGLDRRIGPEFLRAGIGYGGGCLKKDIRALIHMGEKHGFNLSLLGQVDKINENQRMLLVKELLEYIPSLNNKKIAIWGVTFKPNTDDLRDAPSIKIVEELVNQGADICLYDPEGAEKFIQAHFKENKNVQKAETKLDATKNADALMILTEWNEFQTIDFKKVAERMRGNLVLDGRNIYDPKAVLSAGLTYYSI